MMTRFRHLDSSDESLALIPDQAIPTLASQSEAATRRTIPRHIGAGFATSRTRTCFIAQGFDLDLASTSLVPSKMPPRRSTRATASTSVSQPVPVPQPAAKKAAPRRKRTDADESDDEFTTKPAKKKAKKVDQAVDMQDDADDADDSKMVTVLKRGAAPVDTASPYVCT
jgi:hypothetical protein